MATKWGASKNKPDWTDVFQTMAAIERLHSVALFVTMTAGTFDGPSGCTTIAARNVSPMGEASVLGEPVIVLSGDWPCQDHTDFASCVYAALLTLDGQLSAKLWEQLKLPLAVQERGGT